MGRPAKPLVDRFWSKVRKDPDGCWIWTSNHGNHDYGALRVKKGEEYMAHRISWILHYGPIPDGLIVLHKCDIPKCVNPDHLFLGTGQDNMDDMVSKGRSLKGEKSPMHKLTEEEVLEIRSLYQSGEFSQGRLASMYRVNQTNIGFIIRRKSWRHI